MALVNGVHARMVVSYRQYFLFRSSHDRPCTCSQTLDVHTTPRVAGSAARPRSAGCMTVWSRTLHGAGRLTDGVCAFASLCWVSSGERPYVVRRCVGSSSELVVRVIGAYVIFARCRRLCTLRGLDIECRCRLSRPFFSAHQGCRSRGTSCISSTLCVVLMPVPTSTALKTASPVATRLGNVPRPSAITVYRQAALATGRFHGARCSRVRPIDGLCGPLVLRSASLHREACV